ncbi:hypothetical protein Tco_0212681 [Tanacetum coccineum]
MGLWYPKDFGFELIAFSDWGHAGCKMIVKAHQVDYKFLVWKSRELGIQRNKIVLRCLLQKSESMFSLSDVPWQTLCSDIPKCLTTRVTVMGPTAAFADNAIVILALSIHSHVDYAEFRIGRHLTGWDAGYQHGMIIDTDDRLTEHFIKIVCRACLRLDVPLTQSKADGVYPRERIGTPSSALGESMDGEIGLRKRRKRYKRLGRSGDHDKILYGRCYHIVPPVNVDDEEDEISDEVFLIVRSKSVEREKDCSGD